MKCMKTIICMLFSLVLLFFTKALSQEKVDVKTWKSDFQNPPTSSWPGVYWYFMDGNMSAKGMTEDLESMKNSGISSVIFLEVNVGVPRGNVEFLSEEWQNLFVHAVNECRRLGIEMILGVGPGWTGSGGPWVQTRESMQHLVASSLEVDHTTEFPLSLPIPQPKKPYFGENSLTSKLAEKRLEYYKDVAVLAFPKSLKEIDPIKDIDEKALYYRAPYTSVPGTRQFIPFKRNFKEPAGNSVIQFDEMVDLSGQLNQEGILNWRPPDDRIWTIMRFGARNNGAITRPAPVPGLGFESDKFDTVAIKNHLDNYVGKLFKKLEFTSAEGKGGLKRLHMDSWEMGAQNWTGSFREEFTNRRGYDPLFYFPVYAGHVVGNEEISERFLWDLRQTSQELILERHAQYTRDYAHSYGLKLSIEPYDMNPTADLELGNIADVIMAEFWSDGFGFNSAFSVIEAASIAHIKGQAILPAESFTSQGEGFRQFPGSMKNQTDWAFAQGINKLMFHTFQHQPLNNTLKPGMTMGPYGVHWNRNQAWWPMVGAYHTYVSRVQYMLSKGRTSADILYLTPGGSPHVFKAPPSALIAANSALPDRKGYNFDGCAPSQLTSAQVKDRKIVFPGGATYSALILPYTPAMTPALLNKIYTLLLDGATVIGLPPERSPSLTDYPKCDNDIKMLVNKIWGNTPNPSQIVSKTVGKGKIVWGGEIRMPGNDTIMYPGYEITGNILMKMDLPLDFDPDGDVRYTHRTSENYDIYFVSNRTPDSLSANCVFRSTKGNPELWDPITGDIRPLPTFQENENTTTIPMIFGPHTSYLVVFGINSSIDRQVPGNFPVLSESVNIEGPWMVSFDTLWGGPGNIEFKNLLDWTSSADPGIKYYSGKAIYKKAFHISKRQLANKKQDFYLDLGKLENIARVYLNGQEVGIVWTNHLLNITRYLKKGKNNLEIEVANLWVNRLIGDENYENDQSENGDWPSWLENGEKRPTKRYTFVTHNFYRRNDPLLASGLMGPVRILIGR